MKHLIYLLILIFLSIELNAQTQQDIPWATLANSDWPMIKHDPQFTGRSPYKGPQTPTIVWAKDLNDGIFSGPVIGEENNLYFGSYYQLDSADHFYSYTEDGKFRWDYKLGGNRPPQSGILIDSSNTIYFGSLDQYFYAMNSDGTLKWKLNVGFIQEIVMPNIDLDGNIYIVNNPEGALLSIKSNGTLNWSVKYEDGFIEKSPVFSADGKTIYIAGFYNNLYAINLDGTLKWKFTIPLSDKAPLVDSEGNIYFDSGYNLYCLFPNGSVKWIFNDFVMGSHSMPTIDKDGNIYAVGYELTQQGIEASLIAIDYNGHFKWKYTFPNISGDDYWQPLICDKEGTVYLGSTIGSYYYAISSEGELKWKLPLNDYQVDNTGAIDKDGTLYLGVHKSSLWNENTQNLIAIRDTNSTDVKDGIVVTNYKLNQNYPNPFNPTTTIEYQIPKAGFVKLAVYNMLGQKVKTLVNTFKSAGKYQATFNTVSAGTGLPSGIYVYKIQVGNFTSSKKMILLK